MNFCEKVNFCEFCEFSLFEIFTNPDVRKKIHTSSRLCGSLALAAAATGRSHSCARSFVCEERSHFVWCAAARVCAVLYESAKMVYIFIRTRLGFSANGRLGCTGVANLCDACSRSHKFNNALSLSLSLFRSLALYSGSKNWPNARWFTNFDARFNSACANFLTAPRAAFGKPSKSPIEPALNFHDLGDFSLILSQTNS